jgi:hypothetical protein
MNIIKINKTAFLLILFQIIAVFTLLLSACGETTNKKNQMENKRIRLEIHHHMIHLPWEADVSGA